MAAIKDMAYFKEHILHPPKDNNALIQLHEDWLEFRNDPKNHEEAVRFEHEYWIHFESITMCIMYG